MRRPIILFFFFFFKIHTTYIRTYIEPRLGVRFSFQERFVSAGTAAAHDGCGGMAAPCSPRPRSAPPEYMCMWVIRMCSWSNTWVVYSIRINRSIDIDATPVDSIDRFHRPIHGSILISRANPPITDIYIYIHILYIYICVCVIHTRLLVREQQCHRIEALPQRLVVVAPVHGAVAWPED
jgi:hypothetical protein